MMVGVRQGSTDIIPSEVLNPYPDEFKDFMVEVREVKEGDTNYNFKGKKLSNTIKARDGNTIILKQKNNNRWEIVVQ